jgi:integrase
MTEPRLRRLKSGTYVLTRAERGTDGKYRTRTESLGTKDRAEAEAARREIMTRPIVSGQVTVGELIEDYLDHARDRSVGHGQFESLKPIAAHFGAHRPSQVTLIEQRVYRRARGVSEGTLRREFGALIAVFNWAVKYRGLDRAEVPAIDLPAPPRPRQAFLDEAREAQLWALAAADPLTPEKLFVCLALGTGARSGAIYALTWDRVDLTRGKIDFRVPGERETRKVKVATTLNDRLLAVLERARAAQLFARRVIAHDSVRKSLRNFLVQHGFSRVTPHVFRHTFVTLNLRVGQTVWDVAGMVGMSTRMVQEVYGHHVSDARAREIANRRFVA